MIAFKIENKYISIFTSLIFIQCSPELSYSLHVGLIKLVLVLYTEDTTLVSIFPTSRYTTAGHVDWVKEVNKDPISSTIRDPYLVEIFWIILVGFTNTYELGSTTIHFAVGKGHDQFYQFSENIYFAFCLELTIFQLDQ